MRNRNRDYWKARAAAKKKLLELNLPDDLTLDALVQAVSAYRGGIPIQVRLMPEGVQPSVTGLTVPSPSKFLVCHRDTPNPHRSSVVICHELAHIIFKHDLVPPDANESAVPPAVQEMCHDLPPHTVLRVLHRRVFNDPIEREAEALGDLLTLRLIKANSKSGQEPDSFDEVFG